MRPCLRSLGCRRPCGQGPDAGVQCVSGALDHMVRGGVEKRAQGVFYCSCAPLAIHEYGGPCPLSFHRHAVPPPMWFLGHWPPWPPSCRNSTGHSPTHWSPWQKRLHPLLYTFLAVSWPLAQPSTDSRIRHALCTDTVLPSPSHLIGSLPSSHEVILRCLSCSMSGDLNGLKLCRTGCIQKLNTLLSALLGHVKG